MGAPIDVIDLRRALGQFPTGVTVITTLDVTGSPVGVTASSFNTVSLDPPLVLWCVAKDAFSAEVFETAEYFAVNVLGDQQVDISNNFARQSEDKFNGVAFVPGKGGSPLLENTAANFECKTWKLYEGGDHTIVVGEVLGYQATESVTPLIFARGDYAVSTKPRSGKNKK